MIKNFLLEIIEKRTWYEVKKTYNEFCTSQIKTYVNFKVNDIHYFIEFRSGAIAKTNDRFIVLVVNYSI